VSGRVLMVRVPPYPPVQYYEGAVQRGRLRACGVPLERQNVDLLKDSALIRHFLHRHEPPVQDLPLTILHNTDDVRNPTHPPPEQTALRGLHCFCHARRCVTAAGLGSPGRISRCAP